MILEVVADKIMKSPGMGEQINTIPLVASL